MIHENIGTGHLYKWIVKKTSQNRVTIHSVNK